MVDRGTRSVVRDRDVCRRHGVVGVLVEPRAQAESAVIVLGGAEGGLHEADAVALAQEGFAALALAYFGLPGVPRGLVDIPLEYVFRALDLLSARGYPSGSIGLLGGSRGGELALLVGSHDERVGSVVSIVGSGVVTAGIDYSAGRLDRILETSGAAWTFAGRRLPYLPYQVTPELLGSIGRGGTVSLRDAFAALPGGEELEAISIRVEQVRGGVLMVSAGDDESWDGAAYSEVAAERLRAADHPYPWAHVVLDGVGHLVAGPPGGPSAPYGPGPGVTFRYGGDPVLTADARAETWHRTLGFLRYTLPREIADDG